MCPKAVILAAGRGARLCPLTPFIPKEMLPVDGFPALHYVLNEIVDAGVTDVMIVLSEGKETIREYLTRRISPKGCEASRFSEERERVLSLLRFTFVMQRELLGTAHAISLAKDFMGKDPLLVVYPDDLLYDPHKHRSSGDPSRRLLECYRRTGDSVLLGAEIPGALASMYGVLTLRRREASYVVTDIVEKPLDYASDRAHVLVGRMVITPRLMESIPRYRLNDGEGIIPALLGEARASRLSAEVYQGARYDLGSHEGYGILLRDIYRS